MDTFIFYDNVNFIKKGWINRNFIKNQTLFTIPLKNQSQNTLIKDTKICWDSKLIQKFEKNLKHHYFKSKNFENTYSMIMKLLNARYETISELAINSIISFSRYLEIETKFKTASLEPYINVEGRIRNIINICKKENASIFINSAGGQHLYGKQDFKMNNISLKFIHPSQSLSIVDLCFEKDVIEIKELLNKYQLK